MSLPECMQIMNCTNAGCALVDGIYRTITILCRSHSLARKNAAHPKADG
jgi:hypothetical protein